MNRPPLGNDGMLMTKKKREKNERVEPANFVFLLLIPKQFQTWIIRINIKPTASVDRSVQPFHFMSARSFAQCGLFRVRLENHKKAKIILRNYPELELDTSLKERNVSKAMLFDQIIYLLCFKLFWGLFCHQKIKMMICVFIALDSRFCCYLACFMDMYSSPPPQWARCVLTGIPIQMISQIYSNNKF